MQPRYPLAELRPYIRESDGVKCFAPVFKKPKDVFVQQARAIWGDRYDYTDSVYTSNKEPIIIFCPKHQYHFRVAMAQNHVMKAQGTFQPTGCPICAAEKRHGREYGPDWREYLKPSKKNSYVGLIHHKSSKPKKSPEQITAEKAERKARTEALRREQQAYIDKWGAKNLKEAHFLEKLHIQYPGMYLTNLVNFKDKDNKVTLICPTHGEFRITSRQLFGSKKHKAHGCWKCAGLEDPDDRPAPMTADGFFQRIHQLYDATELDFTTSVYRGLENSVTTHCRKHGTITHRASYWLSGKGCEYCNGRFYPPDFERLARAAQGDDYIYKGVENIKNASDSVMVHCGNPDHEWHEMLVWLCLHGSKCRECAGRHQPVEQRRSQFIEDCLRKHGEGHFLIHAEDYVNNDTPIRVRCLVHHYDYETLPDNLLRGAGGCPFCSSSEGEAVIRGWLANHGISFEPQYTLPNLDPALPLQYVVPDFYLPADSPDKFSLVIEYHGKQHYEDIDHFYSGKSVRTFAVQQHRDRYLRQYCADHHLRLLEIPYWEFDHIDSILTSVLIDGNDIPTFEPPADKT